MLASSAITLHGANVKTYLIINGAVAMEAYKADLGKEWGMVHSAWDDYLFDGTNDFLFSSEWHELFNTCDPRNKLTWRGIFTNWPVTTVYNFYTPGEDVVANIAHNQGDLNDVAGYAWGCQEKLKGRMPIGCLVGGRYAGWGFNQYDYGTWFPSMPPTWTREPPADAQNISLSDLQKKPFFLKDPGALFDANENKAKTYAQNNYYWLLARAFPARTYGIAANAMPGMVSWNMPDDLRNGWYTSPVAWGHSSFKNVAYVYTYPMYNRMAENGGVK